MCIRDRDVGEALHGFVCKQPVQLVAQLLHQRVRQLRQAEGLFDGGRNSFFTHCLYLLLPKLVNERSGCQNLP